MRLYKHLFYILLALSVCTSQRSFAAFIPSAGNARMEVADSPVYKGERLYDPATMDNTPVRQYKNPTTRHYTRPYKNHDKEAKLALIMGILGIYPLTFMTSIPAIVLGIIGADRRNKYYKQAVTGIILGAIPIAVLLIILIVALLLL